MNSSILQHLVIFTTLAIFTDSRVQAFLCAPDEHLVQSPSGYPVIGNCEKCQGSGSVNVGEWGRCSLTCGHGSQSRTIITVNACGRQGRTTESRSCNTHTCPVNGGWGTWGQFTPCGKSCGGGIQVRFRSCDHPSPSNGGLSCIGDSLQTASCNSQQCPVNGGWSTWGQFTPCDKSCGAGIHVRLRSCDQPSPSSGGLPCYGNSLETASCNSQQCPILVTITNPTVSVTSTSSPSRKHIGTRLTPKTHA
ncbi:coadhesin isoform X1 [Magallana gigas]|uniref:coadhesin isoform X1 n=1 Tax=Magallana gigas TaxID=29159 RepID=UPI00333F19D4